jgi:hypothetical protein
VAVQGVFWARWKYQRVVTASFYSLSFPKDRC